MVSEVSRQFHFNSSSPGDDGLEFERSSDDHDGVIQRSSGLGDELVGSSSKDDGGRFTLGTNGEHVISFSSELDFFEFTAGSEDGGLESVDGGLDDSSGGLGHTLEVFVGHSSGAEHVSVGEVLSSQISDRELGKHDLSSRGNDQI